MMRLFSNLFLKVSQFFAKMRGVLLTKVSFLTIDIQLIFKRGWQAHVRIVLFVIFNYYSTIFIRSIEQNLILKKSSLFISIDNRLIRNIQNSIYKSFKNMESKKAELQNYLQANTVQFLQPMLTEAAKQRPSNAVDFCLKWLQKYQEERKRKLKSQKQSSSNTNRRRNSTELQCQGKNNSGSECTNSDSDEEHQTVEDLQIIKKRQLIQGKKQSRIAISEQVFGQYNKKSIFAPKKVEKSEESKMLILSLIRNSILFQNIDSRDQQAIIDAMGEKKCKQGQNVIVEGAAGDLLYIASSGEYDCFKNIGGNKQYLKTYSFGESFGELALMYNAPRAATIQVKTAGTLFTLDRQTFSQVVKGASARKRNLFLQTLSRIQIFADLSQQERQQFCDLLKQQRFSENEYVVEQGGAGDKFYIVIQGKLVAEKYDRCSLDPKIVFQYKEGDYFGELALLHDIDRQANIKTLTSVRLASIGRESFMRVLGPLKSILMRNEFKYRKYQGRTSELMI